MKVSELQGEALALWVGKALGYELVSDLIQIGEAAAGMRDTVLCRSEAGVLGVAGENIHGVWRPHEEWAQGGPIIERECGSFHIEYGIPGSEHCLIHARMGKGDKRYQLSGNTHLIAAMRAFVASKFGDEVPD